MKRITGVLVTLAALALPGVASAHTGWVDCTPQGVTFHYNANFEQSTTVTESVRPTDVSVKPTMKLLQVQRYTALEDTVPVFGDVTAWAMWKVGHRPGQIKPVHLNCAASPPPTPPTPTPPTPPAVTPPPATPPPATPVTTPPPAAPAAPPAVTPTVVKPPTKPHTAARCPKDTLALGLHEGRWMCLRTVRIPAKSKGHHVVKGAVHRTPKHFGAGVTG